VTPRCAVLLLAAVALAGCGQGAEDREPVGPWSLDGEAVSGDQIESSAGPGHCQWQAAHFVGLSWPPGRTYDDPRRTRIFVKDPEGVLAYVAPYLRDGYDADAELPRDAVDSGYRNDGFALWHSPAAGDSRIYEVGADGTPESWPKATTTVACD